MNQSPDIRKLRLLAVSVICTLLLMTGCATPQMAALQKRWPDTLPVSAEVVNVPFYRQQDYQCGPAALAMAASSEGFALRPEDVLDQVYLPARKDSLQVEMLAAARQFGLMSFQLKPEMKYLLQEVAAGHPVIVLQNLSFPFTPVWHYAVLTGFDRERNVIRMHSGRTRDMEMSMYTFERTWERGGHWAMLILPPTRIPATADAGAFVGAAMSMELAAPAAAHTAYVTGLQKWPSHPALLLGAGNTAYALGWLDIALQSYRELTRRHPSNADGWNNMAQTLLDQGKTGEATAAIQQAVAIGGERLPNYLELQKEIYAKR